MTKPAFPRLTAESLTLSISALASRDADLARIVAHYGEPPLWERPEGFTTLGRIILEQQVSLASAASLFSRLEREIGGGFNPDSIRALGPVGLQALGLTRQKAAYLNSLAEHIVIGSLDLAGLSNMPDDEAARRLMLIPGIGPWSSGIYLLMALLRTDVWPPGDLALHKAVEQLTGERKMSRDAVDSVAERWRPWRAVAARILWKGYLGGMTRSG